MGTWGTGIYQNDAACDVRADFTDFLRRGKTSEEATQAMVERYAEVLADSEEAPLFWYALADTQWNLGRLLTDVKDSALHYLTHDDVEIQRWREAGVKCCAQWQRTLAELREKLLTAQPPAKRISQYRLYRCKWKLGDVFAYQFHTEYSRETGVLGRFVVFRKISEDTWWPGHIVPVVQVYKWMGVTIPPLAELSRMPLLEQSFFPSALKQNPSMPISYEIKLLSTSERAIPKDHLRKLGNLPGDDLVPFRGSDFWTGYTPVGWDGSKYNLCFEQYIIDQFAAWTAQKARE